MADDRRMTISSSRMHPDDVARHTFGTTRRGYDPGEVRAYLEAVAAEIALSAERERELRDLVAEAEHRAANPVLDEATLTAALGQETARVLRSAHDAAGEVTARAVAEAETARAAALEEAGQLRARAEQIAAERTAHAEAAAADLTQRTQDEATTMMAKVRQEAEALLAQARDECRAMLQEAQDLRTKVLADLTRRRRVLHSQIEQLRAGRERLAETITGVRHSVDVIADELFRAEDEARLAAEEAGRQAAIHAEEAAPSPAETGTEASVETAVEASPATGVPAESAAEASVPTPAAAPTPSPEALEGPDHAAGEDEVQRKQAVEDLFARLRAGREVEEAVSTVSVTEAAEATAAVDAGMGSREPADTAAAAPAPVDTEGRGAAGTGAAVVADPNLARRDELVRPVVTSLARRLKRALQDDQNDILDRLRAAGGWGPKVLPSVKDHQARYAAAATGPLRDAAKAGMVFAEGSPDDAPAVDELAQELASSIVAPLRRRLQGEVAGSEGGDDAQVDRVGAAYREWKGARVERLAGDQATAAFGRGILAAMPQGATLQWIVDDGGMQCPDCDDNALGGPTAPGEPFPTGHAHPPAHAGCRCLIVPVTT